MSAPSFLQTGTSKKSVRFSSVFIREYPMILGDHPAAINGPPVTIDWNYHLEKSVTVEKHVSSPRRTRDQLLMPPSYRKKVIHKAGYSLRDITKVMSETKRFNSQRTTSIKLLGIIPRELINKSLSRRLKKVFSKHDNEVGGIHISCLA